MQFVLMCAAFIHFENRRKALAEMQASAGTMNGTNRWNSMQLSIKGLSKYFAEKLIFFPPQEKQKTLPKTRFFEISVRKTIALSEEATKHGMI